MSKEMKMRVLNSDSYSFQYGQGEQVGKEQLEGQEEKMEYLASYYACEECLCVNRTGFTNLCI